MPKSSFKKRLTAIACAVTLVVPSASSANDLNTAMQGWFNDMGAYGNYSAPEAFRGQTMNMYSGGSLFMRSPVRNYQLASLNLPGYRAGCGGIDMWGGSFSFINSDAFVALLRNIANNSLGIAVNTAICAMSQDLCSQLQYLQDQVSKLNSLNINSCNAANGIILAGKEIAATGNLEAAAGIAGSALGINADFLQSKDEWNKRGSGRKAITDSAKNNEDFKGVFTNRNIVWDALLHINGLTYDERRLIMSVIGTQVIIAESVGVGQDPQVISIGPIDNLPLKKLVGNVNSSTEQFVALDCDFNGSDPMCIDPKPNTSSPITFVPFAKRVHTAMTEIVQKIQTRQGGYSANDSRVALLSQSTQPVWKIIKYAASTSASMSDDIITQSSTMIAYEIAYNYLNRVLLEANKAVSRSKGQKVGDTKQAAVSTLLDDSLKEIRKNTDSAFTSIREEMKMANQNATKAFETIYTIQKMEQSLLSGLPKSVGSSLNAFNKR